MLAPHLVYVSNMKKIDIICIIDDDPIHVFFTQESLKEAEIGASIVVYENGKDAFDNLKLLITKEKDIPDLILLDINMPIWDGWDFLDEFTKIPVDKKITIYVVSSSSNPQDMQKAKTYEQVSNFIVKPISMETLKKELQNYHD